MASAPPSYASTKETANYARLCRLLVDAGSQALRDKFDGIHPPAGLHGILTKPPAHPTLQALRKKRILNPTQWTKLYPTNPLTLSSKDFDVTLLMLLLRNICGLTPPATGWDNLPPAGDTSVEANIVRVKYYRNHVYGHASQASVDDTSFNSYWQEITSALVGLGADAAAISKLKTESMDPVIEKHYQELLKEWKRDDDTNKDKLDGIRDQLEKMNDQMLESEKTISGELRSLTNRLEEANQDKDKVKENMEEIKSEVGNISEKLQTIENSREELPDEGFLNLTEFIDGIRQLYNIREGWLAPFPWCEEFRFNLDSIFTRLKIVSRKKERGTKTNETVTMNDIFKPHEDCTRPRTVLIEGNPGMGKTTYCNKLAYDWATKNKGTDNSSGSCFPHFEVVLLLKCRDMNFNLKGTVEEQLLSRAEREKEKEDFKSAIWEAIDDQLLPRDVTKEEKEEFFRFVRNNQSSVLLVLDGLDEVPPHLLPGFKEIIQGRILPKCHIVVTARHEVGMRVRECCDSLLEIEGFTTNDARKFIFRYFKTKVSLAEKLLNKLNLDRNLRQLIVSPLNTALLCLLCEDFNGVFPESGTQLYLEIIECVLRRYRKKNGLPETQAENLTQIYKTQLKQLGSIALNGLLNDNMYFEKKEFGNGASEIPGFGFLSVERGQSKRRPSLHYGFLHKTFQELFAAFFLCYQLLDGEISPETLTTNNKYFSGLQQVLVFTCGIIHSQSKEMMKAVVTSIAHRVQKGDGDDFVVALKCIDECRKVQNNDLYLLLAQMFGSLLQIRSCKVHFLPHGLGAPAAEAIKCNSTITELDLSKNKLGFGDCAALAEAFRRNSTIIKLDFSRNIFGAAGFTTLTEAIKHNSTITQLNLSSNVFDAVCCTAVAEAIKHNSTITQLDLSSDSIDAPGCAALAEALKHNQTITQLDLSSNFFGSVGCVALAEALKLNQTITQLDLSRNTIGAAGCTVLVEGIKHNSTITQLDLSRNYLGNIGCIKLAAVTQDASSSITQLNLSRNSLGAAGCTVLAKTIQHKSTVTQLDLSKNSLGVAGCKALAQAIRYGSRITHLNLSGTSLGGGSCIAIAEGIEHNSTIKHLDLSENNLGLVGCTAIARAIKRNSTITHLNLSRTKGGAVGCTALVEAIKYNSAITQLDLSGNNLGAVGCTALAEAIEVSDAPITQLNLSRNSLGAAGCTALAEAIKRCSTITQLYLSRNGLGPASCTALAEAVKHNSTLTHLDLSENNLGTVGCTALAEAIKHNSTITYLDLSGTNRGSAGCAALAEAIKHNSTITQLNLKENNHGAACCTALAEAIKHNSLISDTVKSFKLLK